MRWGRRAKEKAGALNARQAAGLGDPASYSPGPPPGDLPRELAGELLGKVAKGDLGLLLKTGLISLMS